MKRSMNPVMNKSSPIILKYCLFERLFQLIGFQAYWLNYLPYPNLYPSKLVRYQNNKRIIVQHIGLAHTESELEDLILLAQE